MGCCKCSRNEGGGYYLAAIPIFQNYNDIKKDERIRQLEEQLEKEKEKNKNKNKTKDDRNDDERIRQLEEEMEKEKEKNKNNDEESSEYESSSKTPANIKINIKYNNKNYEFMTKLKYDLSHVLYKFKKENKGIKPNGHFQYKEKEIDDLSKTCADLGIEYGDDIILE